MLKIRYYGDPVLRAKALPIAEITPEILQLAQEMIEAMIAYNGVGLAAPQIGKLLRIYVYRDERVKSDGEYELGDPEVVINPVLSKPSKESETMLEGCISLPGLRVNVSRPKKVHIRYQNLKGEFVEKALEDFCARVNMHENDHLNGVLHIDRVSPKERKALEVPLQKMKKKYSS